MNKRQQGRENKKQRTFCSAKSKFCLLMGLLPCLSLFSPAFSADTSPITTLNLDKNTANNSETVIDLNKTESQPLYINLTENDCFYHMVSATDRFVQCNIRASWEDFKKLIDSAPQNDFIYIKYANKMADLGFFDLANLAILKMKDKDLTELSTDDLRRFYYPRKKLKLEDEMMLAEAYSNIMFNNQSSETAGELTRNQAALINYDYANYLAALGYYKSNSFSQAAKYINIAILQNPSNINYQKLKAQILAESNEPIAAIKVVENIKKQNLFSYEYEQKVKSLEQFILYKTSKADWEKNYHLGYYYYIENDSSKAVRTLESALTSKKRADKSKIYGLMSEIYFSMNEFEKASDTARKAHKIDKNNLKALLTLGDLNYREKRYKQALEYYKKAASNDKKAYTPLVKEAQTYQKLNNYKKAKEIYTKVLKTSFSCWEAYYNIALMDREDKEKFIIYLKKALAINPMFKDAWVELAKVEIDKGNFNLTQQYLANVFYIDENDFRYYYYQGVVNYNLGDYTQAKFNFKKSLKLNPSNKEAQDALGKVVDTQNPQINQDNI